MKTILGKKIGMTQVFNENGEEVINFGKYKGQLVTTVLKKDPGYYGWIISSDFALDTKKKLTEIYNRMKNLLNVNP
jgi:DNA polymerase-3 subunit epsilon